MLSWRMDLPLGAAANSNLAPEQRGEILDTHLPHAIQVLRTLREIKAEGTPEEVQDWQASVRALIALLENERMPLAEKKRAFEAFWRAW